MRLSALAFLCLSMLASGAHAHPRGAKVTMKDGVKVTSWKRSNGEHVTHEAGTERGTRFFKLTTQAGMRTTTRTVRVDSAGKTTVDHESVDHFNAGGSHTMRLHRVVRGGDPNEATFETQTLAGGGADFIYETEKIAGGVSHKTQQVNGFTTANVKTRGEVPASWQAAQAHER